MRSPFPTPPQLLGDVDALGSNSVEVLFAPGGMPGVLKPPNMKRESNHIFLSMKFTTRIVQYY